MIGLVLLLPCEALVLGMGFDGESLDRFPPGWWSVVFAVMPRLLRVATAVVTIGLLLAGRHLRGRVSEQVRIGPARRIRTLLLAHLVAFACTLGATYMLFSAHPEVRAHAGAWVAAWLASIVLTTLSWAALVCPPDLLRGSLARRLGGVLLIAACCGLLAWAVGQYTERWWDALRRPTLNLSASLLRCVDGSAWADPPQYLIGARDFTVEISRECSGYEGIGLVWVSLGTWFVFARRRLRFPQVFLLLAAATLAVWLANAVRIAALIYIGAHVSPAAALGGFHSYAGALLFAAVVLGSAWVAYRSRFFAREASGG
ncbi:MAG TPA: archaeosortase/exosortase family protein [Tepidisphaeraceae bacterium]